MANGWTNYNARVLLADITVTQLAANVEIQSPNTGTYTKGASSTAQITSNSILQTSMPNGYVAEALYFEIIPPVDADGSTPDVEIVPVLDGKDLKDYMVIDGSADGNMFPRKLLSVGKRYVKLGDSTRDTLTKIGNAISRGRANPVPRLPLRMTGLKISNSLNFKVSSAAGWGQASSAKTPLRILVWGDMLQQSDLAQLSPFFTGVDGQGIALSSVFLALPPTQPLAIGGLNIGGALSVDTWKNLPGGIGQGSTKIFRSFKYAYNNQATATHGEYVFTQSTSMGGNVDNIVDVQHDLGDDFSQSNDAFLWTEFGLRFTEASAGAQGYVGFRVNGQEVPNNTVNGIPVSYGVNDYQYGSTHPQRPDSNLYFPLPEAKELVQLLAYKNSVVPFLSTSGTSSIAANGVSVAKGGVLIQQS